MELRLNATDPCIRALSISGSIGAVDTWVLNFHKDLQKDTA